MYILFKRHGNKRFFKRYNSLEELKNEIRRGHNEQFPGNNQFYYNVKEREIEILNSRLSVFNCEEYLESSNIVPMEVKVAV
ncbi:MAG: hypothetical protein H7Y13_03655 [Sphingobacteriaceae bacterium]|nr:hypothetical protein [Sphingobacteriaceae bacterium]